jgi:hypothetical protein
MVHVMTTITQPGSEISGIRVALDTFLAAQALPEVTTVAETIFPQSLVAEPVRRWSPSLSPAEEAPILEREQELFRTYVDDLLELLLTADGNHSGTYFSRMITWPGKVTGGVNQIADRISSLRNQLRNGRSTYNAMDIDVAADALSERPTVDPLKGLEVYSASDRRNRGFPCLTHVDLTLFEGRLHMTAVYRHQYLVTKAYGNLLGLSWLLQFIADQSGVDVGEIVIHATMADAEFNGRGRERVRTLAKSARAALGGLGSTH